MKMRQKKVKIWRNVGFSLANKLKITKKATENSSNPEDGEETVMTGRRDDIMETKTECSNDILITNNSFQRMEYMKKKKKQTSKLTKLYDFE